ncbi:MAG: hypothetical protein EXS05_06735 [Planctomycetaceae bacterium]|nr:hypothetical protein [Planctomycetaceae bacterium]
MRQITWRGFRAQPKEFEQEIAEVAEKDTTNGPRIMNSIVRRFGSPFLFALEGQSLCFLLFDPDIRLIRKIRGCTFL